MSTQGTAHIPRQPAGSPDGGKFAPKPGGAESPLDLTDVVPVKPQSRVPEWSDGRLDDGEPPRLPGTSILILGHDGDEFTATLKGYESARPPHGQAPIWIDDRDGARVENTNIKSWLPMRYPDTPEGDLQDAYLRGRHFLDVAMPYSDSVRDAIVAKIGVPGVRLSSSSNPAAASAARFRGSEDDGSRSFEFTVHRDRDTGFAHVTPIVNPATERANQVREFISNLNNAENIVTWREHRTQVAEIASECQEISDEYTELTGQHL